MAGVSVFCGWDFPCSEAPDRLVLHSIVGALSVNVVLTMGFVKAIQLLRPARFGLHGFANARVASPIFALSAAVGSLSHVLVDWLHHPANPIFWPFLVDGSYYVDGLLLSFMTVRTASLLVAAASGIILVAVVKQALNKKDQNLSFIFSNPKKALSLITESLS
jgi:membrane-bound metal-dependent hydrolase YbcI (DUF457 family)